MFRHRLPVFEGALVSDALQKHCWHSPQAEREQEPGKHHPLTTNCYDCINQKTHTLGATRIRSLKRAATACEVIPFSFHKTSLPRLATWELDPTPHRHERILRGDQKREAFGHHPEVGPRGNPVLTNSGLDRCGNHPPLISRRRAGLRTLRHPGDDEPNKTYCFATIARKRGRRPIQQLGLRPGFSYLRPHLKHYQKAPGPPRKPMERQARYPQLPCLTNRGMIFVYWRRPYDANF